MNKQLISSTLIILVTLIAIFSLLPVASPKEDSEIVIPTIFEISKLIQSPSSVLGSKFIDNKLKKNPDDNRLLELKLDMLYGTDLFSFLWTPKDYNRSLFILDKLEKEDYALPKVYLYKALYYKNLGQWDMALKFVEQSLEEFNKNELKEPDELYFHSRAMFEKGLFKANQSDIVDAIEELELALSDKPENIIFLTTINEMMRYIEVPEDLFESFQERVTIYEAKLKKIQSELTVTDPQNVLNKKIERDNLYYNKVMKPITQEILRRWKQAKSVQRTSADLLFFFQVTKKRKIINIKLISSDHASENLINISKLAIENTIVPYLPDTYPLETMNILFTFSYN